MRPVSMDARDPYLYLKLSGGELMRRLKSGAADPSVPGLVETAMFVGDAEYAETPPPHLQVSRVYTVPQAHVDTVRTRTNHVNL